jgi:Domain of unknown function (DUF4908)
MTGKSTASMVGKAIVAALVAANLSGFGAPAFGTPIWLQHALASSENDVGRPTPPRIARYEIDEGGVFVLDLSGRIPLMKFEDNPEVLVLYAVRGPRGDVIYRNDLGEPILRATKLGGMTVFTTRRPEGSAAALLGSAAPLHLAPLGPVLLYQRLVLASVRCSRSAQHLIGFDAPAADAASDAIIADAAAITTTAVAALAAKPSGRVLLSRLTRVNFAQGARPAVNVQNGVMTITVTPAQGVAGRPSSKRILQAMAGR